MPAQSTRLYSAFSLPLARVSGAMMPRSRMSDGSWIASPDTEVVRAPDTTEAILRRSHVATIHFRRMAGVSAFWSSLEFHLECSVSCMIRTKI